MSRDAAAPRTRDDLLRSLFMSAGAGAQAGTPAPRRTLTRAQLAERISQGEVLVLRRRLVYKLDRWVHQHPGGELSILHFVGRDAKDEIEVYHSEDTINRLMFRFVIAHLAEEDCTDVAKGKVYKPLVPPVQLGYRDGRLDHPHAHLDAVAEAGFKTTDRITKFPLPVGMLEPPAPSERVKPLREARISAAFEEMHADVKDAGLYELRPHNYVRECARYITAGVLSVLFFRVAPVLTPVPSFIAYMLSAVCLGFLWHQVTFAAHDAGHTGITHIYWVDRLIGVMLASYLGGLSLIWWCDNHDVHHLVTNHPEHDPDIQHMPIFAISPSLVHGTRLSREGEAQSKEEGAAPAPTGLWSSYYRRVMEFDVFAKFLLYYQHRLYFIIMSLARFNLYALSYGFLLTKARRDRWLAIEATGVVFFWYWLSQWVLRNMPDWRVGLAYMLVSHIVTSPLHVQVHRR